MRPSAAVMLLLILCSPGFDSTAHSQQSPPQSSQTAPTKKTQALGKAVAPAAANPKLPAAPIQSVPPDPCAGTDPPEVVYNNGKVTMNSWVESGDTITVPICGLEAWIKNGQDHNPLNLRLFLAGRLLKGSAPIVANVAQQYLNFKLDLENADQEDRAIWVEILNAARKTPQGRIVISVGILDKYQPFVSHVYVTLNVYPWYTPLVIALLAVLLVSLMFLGWRSNLLRDTTKGLPGGDARAPFSLGRLQMACWFFLVVAAYLYIWLVIGGKNSLNGSILALMGISAGTGLASVFVDQQKYSDLKTQRATLEAEQKELAKRISELQAAHPTSGSAEYNELQTKSTRLLEVNGSLGKLPPPPAAALSDGFWKDILRDGDGISFHRFQIFAWTGVLSLVFIRGVYSQLTMPTFDATLLGLMGLSSGTYVGFKFPETTK